MTYGQNITVDVIILSKMCDFINQQRVSVLFAWVKHAQNVNEWVPGFDFLLTQWFTKLWTTMEDLQVAVSFLM
jgi:hypothetical protein